MAHPTTHYLERDGAQLAYQTLGDGPRTVLVFFEISMHLDLMWADPYFYSMYERPSRLGRIVLMQQRGVGLSEPVPYVATQEQKADDVVAVLDAVGADSALLVGQGTSCSAVALVAARTPERVDALVLLQPLAQGMTSGPLEELAGYTADDLALLNPMIEKALANWGQGYTLDYWDAEAARTDRNRRASATFERTSMTPRTARAIIEYAMRADDRDIYRSVHIPAHVWRIHGSLYPEAATRYVAELLPQGHYFTLPEVTEGMSTPEGWMPALEHVEALFTGTSGPAPGFLAALLFTDVAGSTRLIAELGNPEYQRRFAAHTHSVHAEVERAGGQLQQVKGDGTFSAFDGPVAAIRAALAIQARAEALGLPIRAGVHLGEVEQEGPELTGLSVHTAARICAAAEPGEVLVSQAASRVARGTGLAFAPRGRHVLKGVDGEWELVAASAGEAPAAVPTERPAPRLSDRALVALTRRRPRLARRLVASAQARDRQRAVEP